MGDHSRIEGISRGTANMKVVLQNPEREMTLRAVLFVLGLSANLFSQSKATAPGTYAALRIARPTCSSFTMGTCADFGMHVSLNRISRSGGCTVSSGQGGLRNRPGRG